MLSDDQMPIRIEVVRSEHTNPRWSQELILCWQMTGNSLLYIEKAQVELLPDTLVLIPTYQLFHLEQSQGQILLFHIDPHNLDSTLTRGLSFQFTCFSTIAPDKQSEIKTLLAKLARTLSTQQRFNHLLIYSQLSSLLYELCVHYSSYTSECEPEASKIHHIEKILRYIDENYTTKLTLDELGKHFFMSPSYLSRLFKSNMAITPGEYINMLRLKRAKRLLKNTDYRMEDIAESCGFADVHAFIRNFKQMHHQTPGQYRKNLTAVTDIIPGFEQPDTTVLEKYWNMEYKVIQHEIPPEVISRHSSTVSLLKNGVSRKNTAFKFIQIENAAMLLQANIQSMLKRAKDEIGVEYVSFHGLLDDVISIYLERPQTGSPFLVFQNLDYIFDFLMSIGLKPVVEFSYMPRRLASELHMPGVFDNSIISMPKSMELWESLITGIMDHLLSRYGKKQVSSWLYCCWQIPDLQESHYTLGSEDAFYTLYQSTWNAVKAVESSLLFGIPNMTADKLEEGSWFNHFLNFCKEQHCMPDFMGYSFYAISKNVSKDDLGNYRVLTMSTNPNAFRENLKIVKEKARDNGWNIPVFYVPSWNYTFSGNPLEDTTYRAVYIIKNVLENMDETDGLGCGMLSDHSIYARTHEKTYYGFRGLFTGNGIPKAAYYAYTLLSRLGSHVLSRGDGWYVTRKGDDFQILFYYYEHFSTQYANSEYFATTNTERYQPFAMDKRLQITIPCADLPFEKYLATEITINRTSGSSFDKWLEMGALPVESFEMAEYLRAVSTPKITQRVLEARNGILEITATLEPLEIRFIELRP